MTYGWRVWNIFPHHDCILRSPYVELIGISQAGTQWTRRTKWAECTSGPIGKSPMGQLFRHKSDHTPPGDSCACGVYADPEPMLGRTLERMQKMAGAFAKRPESDFPPFNVHPTFILGRIQLRGTVVLDTLLMDPRNKVYVPELRAELGRITELWVPHEAPQWFVDSLTDRYKVPVQAGLPDPAEYEDLPLPDVPAPAQSKTKITAVADALPELAQMLTESNQENEND